MKLRIFIFIFLSFTLFKAKEIVAQSDTLKNSHQLLLASYHNSIDSVLIFLKKGVRTDYYDDNGFTALMYAIQNNNEDIVKLLVYNGFDINAADIYRTTCLSLAVRLGFFDIAEYLCYSGANPNKDDWKNLAPLDYAVLNADYFMADMLLFYGSDVNHTTRDNNTALHFAATINDTALSNLLIRNGAIINTQNRSDLTPVDVAIQYNTNSVFASFYQNDSVKLSGLEYLNMAIHYSNVDAGLLILNSISPPDSLPKPINNPLILSSIYRYSDLIKPLKKAGFKRGKQLLISHMFFNTAFLFNESDKHFRFDFGLSEARLKVDFLLSYGSRFKPKKILIPAGVDAYYQYIEKRNFISFGLQKAFYPIKSIAQMSVFARLEAQVHFGSYRGSSREISPWLIPSLSAGMKYHFDPLYMFISAQYSDWKIYEHSPYFINIGVGIKGLLIQKPPKFSID